MIAAVKVRGDVDASRKASETLKHLNLTKKNRVVVYEDSDSVRGMLNHAKDYIAYGELSDELLEKLEEKKGEDLESGDIFDLNPPTGGYKSTKRQAGQGGALGRRENLDELVGRMV